MKANARSYANVWGMLQRPANRVDGNRILSVLAVREPKSPLFSRLRPVTLSCEQVLAAASAPVDYGYFFIKGMACGLSLMSNGATTADFIIGPEGFAGLPLLFGSITAQPVMVVMKIPGVAMRIDADVFLKEFNKPGCFQEVMRRYGLAQVASITQVAACNTLHCLEERLACWLLLAADRVGTDFTLTHEAIAHVLGNRRPTVSLQMERFERVGLIAGSYGRIRIRNRPRLEKLACECYEIHRKLVENTFAI